MDRDYVLLRTPMYVNWNYTYKCNFHCIHCYSRDREDLKDLTTEEKMTVAQNLVRNKVFNVNLGGGEPILCEDCVDIIRYMATNHINVNLSTNGWKTSADKIEELKKAGLNGVFISLDHIIPQKHDAIRNREGSFYEACESIKKYVDAHIKVNLSTVITSENFDVLEELINFGSELGVTGIDLKRLKTAGNAKAHHELEISEAQRDEMVQKIPCWKEKYPININLVYGTKRIKNVDAGCPCGKTSLAILCNGDISPCVYNVKSIGNALVDDIGKVWREDPFLSYFRSNFECLGMVEEVR